MLNKLNSNHMKKFVTNEQEAVGHQGWSTAERPAKLKIMKERIIEDAKRGIVQETIFEEEEEISELEKASDYSLSGMQQAGIDLSKRPEMPHFYRAEIMSSNVKEQLQKTSEYLDYLQEEAKLEATRAQEAKQQKQQNKETNVEYTQS